MRKVFISGICGFLGSSLANFFLRKNYKVSGIDNLSRKGSYKNYLKLKKERVQIFKGNLCDNFLINKILKKKINLTTLFIVLLLQVFWMELIKFQQNNFMKTIYSPL